MAAVAGDREWRKESEEEELVFHLLLWLLIFAHEHGLSFPMFGLVIKVVS